MTTHPIGPRMYEQGCIKGMVELVRKEREGVRSGQEPDVRFLLATIVFFP